MNNQIIFASEKEVRFGKVLRFILPTYLTSLFNTLYTIVDGIFVSQYVGTNALAAINIVYPIVNILTGIALVFAAGGSAMAAISIGAHEKKTSGTGIFYLHGARTRSRCCSFFADASAASSTLSISGCNQSNHIGLQDLCSDLACRTPCSHRKRIV